MKKFLKNPLTYVLMISAILILGSNVCCVGEPTKDKTINKDKNVCKLSNTESTTGIITLTESTFNEKIKSGITLVDFWASWCMPCKMQAPAIEKVSTETEGKVLVGKLDVDQNPSIANQYNVQGIPTMILFKDGKEVKRFVGLTSKEDIIAAINNIKK